MNVILDDPATEQQFRQLLAQIRQYRNGETAANMRGKGVGYKLNWGVSLVDLRSLAREYQPSHLLAMKLWNRQWRETLILASLLDTPAEVTEQQMDFWTKNVENSEIAEQLSANLWCRTPFAYIKALEWCRGKKHWLRYTGIHLMGRLAMSDQKSPDEMFEPFFEELLPLSKDAALTTILYRSLLIMGNRSEKLRQMTLDFIGLLKETASENSGRLAEELEAGLA